MRFENMSPAELKSAAKSRSPEQSDLGARGNWGGTGSRRSRPSRREEEKPPASCFQGFLVLLQTSIGVSQPFGGEPVGKTSQTGVVSLVVFIPGLGVWVSNECVSKRPVWVGISGQNNHHFRSLPWERQRVRQEALQSCTWFRVGSCTTRFDYDTGLNGLAGTCDSPNDWYVILSMSKPHR